MSNLLRQLDYVYQHCEEEGARADQAASTYCRAATPSLHGTLPADICTKLRAPATETIKCLIAPPELTQAEVTAIVAAGRVDSPELAAKLSGLFNIETLDTVRITAHLSALLDVVKLGKDPRGK